MDWKSFTCGVIAAWCFFTPLLLLSGVLLLRAGRKFGRWEKEFGRLADEEDAKKIQARSLRP